MKNNMIKRMILLVVGTAFMLPVFAQNARNITLDEAITLSLQNSKQLKLSQAKIAEATANLNEARERRLPDLSATGSYIRLNEPTVDLKLKLGSSGGSSEGSGSGS